ncbi:MAG: 2-dehydropantoate 2-reductase [Candidatus Caldatribacteriota bacterium]
MNKIIKNVCIYGLGGVGGYLGGRIAYKINKENFVDKQVFFISRGEHLKKIQQKGLKVITDQEEFTVFPNIATDNINQIPMPDIYWLCVKAYSLVEAITSIAKKVSSTTIIIPLLNGVDIYERIRSILNKAIVLPATIYISSSIEKPGQIRQVGPEGHIVLGKDPRYPELEYENVIDFLRQFKISFTWHNNPYPAIWGKYIFISAFSLVTAYSGKTIGGVLEDEELRKMTQSIMQEVVNLAEKKGINLEPDIVEKNIQKAIKFPYHTRTSFQRDLEKGKNQNEGDIFGGTLIRLAKDYHISIPTITRVWEKISEDNLSDQGDKIN